MTYKPHWLLAWGGPLGTQGEQWQNSLRLSAPDGLTWGNELSDVPAALEDVTTDLRTHMMNAASGYTSSSIVEWVKLNPIDQYGHYADTTTTYAKYLSGTDRIIPTTAAKHPSFVALCVSFLTNRQRGPASRGRLFVPQPSFDVSPQTGHFSVGLLACADAWTAFLDNINNWPGADPANSPNAAIMSNVGAPGPWEAIRRVSIGDVPDIQSRRKNALTENYTSATAEVTV